MDSAGNIYVADQYYSLIRKITPSGYVTTIAGWGYGYTNANGTNARFAGPWDVAVDAAGNVYVADTYNNVIRKIDTSYNVTTLAGTSTAGYADGPAASAQFNYPAGVTVAPDGTIYVADQDNNRIRKISTSGVVSTFAGSGAKSTVDGIGTAASFASPHSISIDAAGNMYVGDEYSHKVRKIAPDGTVGTLAGTTEGYQDGLSTVAQFDHPLGVVSAPSGVIYVVERANNRVRVIQYQ
jgi:sugar lactone lactonase YvrE